MTRMMQALQAALLIGSTTTLSLQAAQAEDAILIGGGYDINSSQGQIELNVTWVQGLLEARGLSVETYYTDGDAPAPDVYYALAPDAEVSALAPLARVFGDQILEYRKYRNNEVPGVAGSTRRSDLEPRLRDIIERTTSQSLLLVYNGHGSQSFSTPDQVAMNLWDNTTMTASELHELLAARRDPFRFVFTQCYSGGFHRLAFEDPASGIALANGPRCGFTAESAYRMAEGCSASVDTDDYRDYTTYFFAALSGFERDGEIISRTPDLDKDGTTSLREAHLFTLEEAYSTDLSRSTSEEYLTQWQPWYLRWLPSPKNLPNNEYARLYRELATRHDVSLDANAANTIRQRLADAELSMHRLEEQLAQVQNEMMQLQYEMQGQLIATWPALMGPYTGAYHAMADNGELLKVAQLIETLPGNEQLIAMQDKTATLELELLEQERQATQYLKLLRLRRLALLQQQLTVYGSQQEQSDYLSLVNCEEMPLLPGKMIAEQ